ncbi:MAG: EF-P lysine aminoacylase EpmA [Microgenomates group bacterium]
MQAINQVLSRNGKNYPPRDIFIARSVIVNAIREFFVKENFLEVETPTLVTSPDPSPFNEVFKIEGKNLYLTPSPEFFLKKLLAAGLKNIYQMAKAYRDWQENDLLHLSEFTILEWYRTGADYFDLMVDCENLINHIQQRLSEKSQNSKVKCQNQISNAKILKYQQQQIDLSPPWLRISCKEAFKRYANVNLDEFINIERARKICRKRGYQVEDKNSWEELYHQLFLNEVEPSFPKDQPLILYDYPAPLAALSQIKKSDPRYAERFEFYIGGLELGNGYSELTDWHEQEKRLKKDIETRKSKGMKIFDYDHEFIEALKRGLPQTAGIAVGVDRLIMLFTDSEDIHKITPLSL